MERYYTILYTIGLIFLGLCLFAALLRTLRGPRIADRIVGINMIGTLSLAAIAILAVMLKQNWLLDVSLIYAMISFLAVMVLAKIYITAHAKKGDNHHA